MDHTSCRLPSPRADIHPSLTVNEVLRLWPDTIATFGALGMDSCCGGASTLREAAEQEGIPVDEVMKALRGATGDVECGS